MPAHPASKRLPSQAGIAVADCASITSKPTVTDDIAKIPTLDRRTGGQGMQDVDRVAHVETFTEPGRRRGPRM